MAMSEEEIPDTAQEFLVCGTNDCEKYCQLYCNDCHQPMCEKCRDEHQSEKNQYTKNHEVVPYRQRKQQLPVEKCKRHPTRHITVFCYDCSAPLCSKCTFMEEHCGHKFDDLEEILAKKCTCCQAEILKIRTYFLSTSKNLKLVIQEDQTKIKKVMDDIRNSMKAEAKSVKELVDRAILKKLEDVNTMEKSLITMLKSQETTYDEYIKYLKNLDRKFHTYLSLRNFRELFSEDFENLKIKNIPETTTPVLPIFIAGQFCNDDIYELLGNMEVPNIEPALRTLKSMEYDSTESKPTRKEQKIEEEKPEMKQTLSLSFSVTKAREYTVPGVDGVYHISLGKSGILWVSDMFGNLVQTNLQGSKLHTIKTSGVSEGYHTVTQDGDLIYTDKDNKVINRISLDKTITEFFETGNWEPLSIHSSHINGDLLVGMANDSKGKVTRYNKTGTEIQNIQRDNNGQELYEYPHYITENSNGDVCVSDFNKKAVVVVDKSGQHRFSYTGQGSVFYPYGLCTNIFGHILLCDTHSDTFHLLNKDGKFLSLLLTIQQGLESPRGVSVDDENNLWVGHQFSKKVTIYKYLEWL